MHKIIATLIITIFISVYSVNVQADELKLGNDLAVQQNTDQKTSSIEERIALQSKPYDDIKISEGVNAGIMSGRDDYTIENEHKMPTEKKGRELGVGISLSF